MVCRICSLGSAYFKAKFVTSLCLVLRGSSVFEDYHLNCCLDFIRLIGEPLVIATQTFTHGGTAIAAFDSERTASFATAAATTAAAFATAVVALQQLQTATIEAETDAATAAAKTATDAASTAATGHINRH
jgi:hypothetical protein